MGPREVVAAIMIPLLGIVILALPGWVFAVLLGLAVVIAGDELLTMAKGAGLRVGRIAPLAALSTALGGAWWVGPEGLLVALIAAAVVLPALQLAHSDRPAGALAGAATSVFTVAFLGATGACLGWLRLWPQRELGTHILLFFLIAIWIGDSGAYYVGRRFGRHRMSPRISPKKTFEGLAGGVVGTFGFAVAMQLVAPLPFGWAHTLVLAGVLAVAAPLGDLIESQFKRDTAVKDSSSLLPGHGGMLDRTDSLLWAAPPVLGYLLLLELIP